VNNQKLSDLKSRLDKSGKGAALMCQSFKKSCVCGKNTAEIFFGRNILDEKSVAQVYCPRCSVAIEKPDKNRVWDKGWILELDPEVLQTQAGTMEIPSQEISAERVFDQGFATWLGITREKRFTDGGWRKMKRST